MDYQSALEYILKFADYERLPRSAVVFDLGRVARLLAGLGNPQDYARTVHVAGTKGKGSTAAMIASMLAAAGYHTGLYTSPHLLSFTERVQVNGEPIAEADFARLTEALEPEVAAENRRGDMGQLTTFEILTALAFLHFREVAADYQVMETGLGGRLDATNVVKPEVCVITSISYDHTDVLGDTLAKIAGEKAGIIKPGCTVVCAPQFPEAMTVIEKICAEKKARLIRVGVDMTWRRRGFTAEGQSFTVKGLKGEYELELPLLGEYQLENAAVAVAVVEVLIENGAKVPAGSIGRGLAGVRWPGRLQVLRRKPWLVIDGAHNAYSAERLVEALPQYFSYKQAWLIVGASSDKDVAGMVAGLSPLTENIIVCGSRHPRAVKPADLVAEFDGCGIKAEIARDVVAAVELALSRAGADDLICATGSIFVIAEVMEHMATKL
ncbi:bifunctional folylpolyglutamate synthase/dihydrofolate synthase [Chloroflexota bacterium]